MLYTMFVLFLHVVLFV